MLRLFIAISAPPFRELKILQQRLLAANLPVKLVAPRNVHITLKFLGDTQERLIDDLLAVMEDATAGVPAFDVAVSGVGAFPGLKRVDSVWLGMEDPGAMPEIARNLDEKLEPLGFRRENRPFKPHLTIARVKGRRGADKLLGILKDYESTYFGAIRADRILLKKSVLGQAGPVYTTLGETRLE